MVHSFVYSSILPEPGWRIKAGNRPHNSLFLSVAAARWKEYASLGGCPMRRSASAPRHTAFSVRDLVLTGLLTAIVFVATRFINVRLPISINGGLIHCGNVALFLAAIVFGGRMGAVAGAVGMGLFDVVSGWAPWAPFTFVIRGAMGLIVGSFAYARGRRGESLVWNTTGICVASVWMIAGYYVTEGLLYGNWVTPATSIPGNVAQLVIGAVAGLPLAAALKKTGIA